MKKLNQTYIDNLIGKVINETIEEKADNLAKRIKDMEHKERGHRRSVAKMSDEEIEALMSSDLLDDSDIEIETDWTQLEEGETCEQCGKPMAMEGEVYEEGETCECGNMYESDMVGDLENPGSSFDYVEEDNTEDETDLELLGADDDGDPLDRVNRFCDSKSDEYNEESCKYHKKLSREITEKLHGGQRKLDKNRNGRIDSEDFKMLRKREEKEGNAFTGALAKAKASGEDEFQVDGKKYDVTESDKKWIQDIDMKKGGLKSFCNGKVTCDCVEKAMKSKNHKKQAQLYLNMNSDKCKDLQESKKHNNLRLSEEQIIDLIEKIIKEEKEVRNNIKMGNPKGLEKYKQVHAKDGKENDDYLKSVVKKMKDYLKDGSMGDYDMNPDIFPKGNGELGKMKKKAYIPSGAVEDYIDNFTAAGLENLDYDGINPNEEWVTANIEGSSKTGNNPDWANTGKSDVNKKRNKIRKDNLLAKIKRKAYNKAPQPVINDNAGEDEGSKIMTKLESIEPKGGKKLNEEFDRMKSLIGYNQKTQ